MYQNRRFLYNAAKRILGRRAAPVLILLALAIWAPACAPAPKPDAAPVPPRLHRDFHDALSFYLKQEKRRGTLSALPESGFILKPLVDGVYFFSNGAANTLFVVSPQGAVLVDPIAGAGPLLKQAIAEVTAQPVTNLMYTTAHPAHIGDAGLFGQNVSVVAHRTTTERLRKDPRNGVPRPQFSFNKNYVLKTPNHTLHLSHGGGGSGVTRVHLLEAGVLMVADRAVPGWVPFVGAEESIQKRMEDVQQMLRLNFHTYLAGHGHRPGERRDMERVLAFYQAGRHALRFAVKRFLGKDALQDGRVTLPPSQLSKHQQDIERECVRLLKINWENKLVGFRALAPGHCAAWFREHAASAKP